VEKTIDIIKIIYFQLKETISIKIKFVADRNQMCPIKKSNKYHMRIRDVIIDDSKWT
jgi:hypothetical protein